MGNWAAWLVRAATLGIQYCQSKTDERKLIQTNIGVYIAMLTILIFDTAFLINGNQGLIYSGLVQTPFLMLLPTVLLLNLRGLRFEATLWLFVLVMLDAFTALVLAQGVTIGLHYYFLLFAILPASFLDSRQWLATAVLFLVNMMLFTYFESFGWQPHPAINEVPEVILHHLRVLMIGSCVATVLLLILISEFYSSENERNLQHLADTDTLTGLPNRRAFMHRLEQVIQEHSPFCLMIVDVDHFKRINDSAGHLAGDQALRFLANELKMHLRANDFIGRIGGEEFAIVQFSPSPTDNINRAERLCRDIAATGMEIGAEHLKLTISIGVCLVAPPTKLVNVLTLADAALYEAKSNGRNRIEVTESLGGF